jgi:transcription termination factor Rho
MSDLDLPPKAPADRPASDLDSRADSADQPAPPRERPARKSSRPRAPRRSPRNKSETAPEAAAVVPEFAPAPAREVQAAPEPPVSDSVSFPPESTPPSAPSPSPRQQQQPQGQPGGGENGDPGQMDRRERKKRFRKNRKERWKEQRERERERESTVMENSTPVECAGLTEISPKGFGFLRQRERNYQQHPEDVFITPEVVRIHGLRDGLWVKCLAKQGVRGPQLTELLEINGKEPAAYHNLPYFEELTAINPNKRLALETKPDRLTTRVIDMLTPIGRGQRGLIVAPPRTGKTTFLHHIAEGILENYEDEIHLMVMLIDERPEEVTDFQRSFPQADLFASSNDSDVKNHTRISQLAIERAKRLVEAGEHVFILLDSITRLARAFNNAIGGGKKRGTQTGGIAVGALEIPRKLFAAARNTREGGSLTIIATALIQTNFKMDDAIFQEFKGTGNMELVLDRQLAQNYVYPAVDIHRSGTRREELLIANHQLEKIYVIRRGLSGYKPMDAMEWLIKCMQRYPGNAQMLMDIKTSAVA